MAIVSLAIVMEIAVIGAGGLVFPVQLVCDILTFPALRDVRVSLMDVDPEGLERTASALRRLVREQGLGAQIETTTDRRAAIDGATFVIVTFQMGGRDAYRVDLEVPRRFGIDQTVGDTLGPGGVFRFLRSAPVYRGLAADIRELAPDALVINYANPMAMNTWFLDELGVRVVGMCHSIPNTAALIARELRIPVDELEFRAAGINHQAWFLRLRHRGQDVYPQFREAMRHHLGLPGPEQTDPYEGYERVRTEVMDAFGYFQSESSHHASEYLPYFRRTPESIRDYLPKRWDYFEITSSIDVADHNDQVVAAWRPDPRAAKELSAALINAIVTGSTQTIYGNVRNRGLISNLPDCVVEVPCLVDQAGVHPMPMGELPPQCAAINRTNINVQELALEAVLTGDKEQVYRAVALDPLTAAVVMLPEIRVLVDELFEAEARWVETTFGPRRPVAS
jgi:alpha-galactosidase